MLSVLDGAVLVVSAVEGVQAQTRVLMRALRRLRIPTLLFVNKIDRSGARDDGLLADIADQAHRPRSSRWARSTRWAPADAAFTPYDADDERFAERLLDLLAEHDDALIAAYVADERSGVARPAARGARRADPAGARAPGLLRLGDHRRRRRAARRGPRRAAAGRRRPTPAAPVSGTVFKVDRGPAGEKMAYVRMFAGTVRVRDRLTYHRGDGTDAARSPRSASSSAAARSAPTRSAAGPDRQLSGLADVRIGDASASRRRAAGRTSSRRPRWRPSWCRAGRGDRGALHARAHPARRAGPADRPAPGRRAPGDLRLALRRGAEGGRRRPRWPTSTAWT